MTLSRKSFVSVWFGALALGACRQGDRGIKPQVKPLMEAVYASGFVVAKDEYQVFSQAEGYLAEKLVADGAEVKVGDPLFVIEADQQSSRYRLAKTNYEMALSNYREGSPVLEELNTAISVAKTKLAYDSINFTRYKNLWERSATTRAEYDRIKLLYENSKNDLQLQRNRYEKVKNQLYIDVQNSKSTLQIANDESGRYTVRSQVDGKVFRTMKEKGELVRRNEAVAVIGKDSLFYLQLRVDELDVQRVAVGQEVLVKIDAFGAQIFHARITKIYPMIDQQQQSIRVDADLVDRLPGAFSGLALEANIVVHQKGKALVIPKAALLPGDSLQIETADGIQKIKVTTGIATLDEVEIKDGLDSTDRVILPGNPK